MVIAFFQERVKLVGTKVDSKAGDKEVPVILNDLPIPQPKVKPQGKIAKKSNSFRKTGTKTTGSTNRHEKINAPSKMVAKKVTRKVTEKVDPLGLDDSDND
jgi:hypothetical protein